MKQSDIEKYLQQEDEKFEKRVHGTKVKKKTVKKKVKNKTVDPKNIDEVRDAFMEELLDESDSVDLKTKSGKKFKQQNLEQDLREILVKYGLNPDGDIERQIVATFISNLYSANLVSN